MGEICVIVRESQLRGNAIPEAIPKIKVTSAPGRNDGGIEGMASLVPCSQ